MLKPTHFGSQCEELNFFVHPHTEEYLKVHDILTVYICTYKYNKV